VQPDSGVAVLVVVAEEPLGEGAGVGQAAELVGEDRGVLQRLERDDVQVVVDAAVGRWESRCGLFLVASSTRFRFAFPK
jgi:hypothetical protein